jgi:hypothetical protein
MNSNKDYIDGLFDALNLARAMVSRHHFTPYEEAKILHLDDFESKIIALIKKYEKEKICDI